jgi:hypothetical protein
VHSRSTAARQNLAPCQFSCVLNQKRNRATLSGSTSRNSVSATPIGGYAGSLRLTACRPSRRGSNVVRLDDVYFRGGVTYQAYEVLCRRYGMTMANIRFKEAWAMARWLSREGLYEIDRDSSM